MDKWAQNRGIQIHNVWLAQANKFCMVVPNICNMFIAVLSLANHNVYQFMCLDESTT